MTDVNSSARFKKPGTFTVISVTLSVIQLSCINSLGNRDGMVPKTIHELLNRSGDPYLSAIYVMRNTFDFDKEQKNMENKLCRKGCSHEIYVESSGK